MKKFQGRQKHKRKINDSDVEISEDYGQDTEVDANSESYVCSESGEQEGIDNNETYLEETLPLEDQGYPNSIVGDLYNQLEVQKDDY